MPVEREASLRSSVRLEHIAKEYKRGGETLRILDGVDLSVPRGTFAALMGPSGSGKSTILHLVAGLDRPTSGTVEVSGARIDTMSSSALAEHRARHLGVVFQTYNLLPVLTAEQNVALPLYLLDMPRKERLERARVALSIVGLEHRMTHYPNQLSGGQEQRVAIARAIVNDPEVIVADEPTGDLDRASADDILELFVKLSRELSKTILMVTHDPAAAQRADVVHHLDKGSLS